MKSSIFFSSSIAVILIILTVANCATKDQWRSRTIYQVLTDRFAKSEDSSQACQNLGNYCGGTYRGLINNLDYIANMGFDAIWITPIIDNTDGGYHGYWGRNWYGVNSNFGSEQDLQDFISACHNKDIWVMIDVVQNHVGPVGTDYSSINPFNQNSNYHSYCEIQSSDFNSHNQNAIEWCRLAGLPDLYQEDPTTKSQLLDWTQWLMDTFKPDGLRTQFQKFIQIIGLLLLKKLVFSQLVKYLMEIVTMLQTINHQKDPLMQH